MPSFPSSSNVFGRLTGRKQVAELEGTAGGTTTTTTTTTTSPPTPDTPPKTSKSGTRRRGSSVLSLSGVTDLGQNVKRSVSLRSHRSQASASSTTFAHKSRTSSFGLSFNPNFTTSPIEGHDDDSEPPFFPAFTRVISSQSSRSRDKTSISAKSLSSKLSSPTLSTYSPPDTSEGSVTQRPTTAAELRRVPSVPMIPVMGALPRRTPAPPLPPAAQSSSSATDTATPFGIYTQAIGGVGTMVPNHASSHDPKAVYKQIHEVSAKRMATMDYLRRVHEGNIFYFSTMHYTPTSLQSIPSMHPLKLGRRATNYFVLGYSLPALLDLNSNSPLEYLRALTSLLQEFETYQTLMGVDSSGNSLSRGRVGNMFKLGARSKPNRRTSTATDNVFAPPNSSEFLNAPQSAEATSPMESSPVSPVGHDFQHLVTPHLPFDPDFGTVYATLCDTLIDTYAKLMDLVPTPEACTPAVGDAFGKVDKTIRKILVAGAMREFEESTRASVKGEVAGLGKLVLGGLM